MKNNLQNFKKYVDKHRPGAVEYNLSKDTEYYSKKYQLYKYGTSNNGWNDSTDAFRHAYGSAKTVYLYGDKYSSFGMIYHEIYGNIYNNQDSKELNMDLWNNQVGQEIGKEVSEQIKGMENMFNQQAIEDYIAEKVMQRMRAGDLITHPDDTRKFSDYHKIKARKEELIPKTFPVRYSANVPTALLKDKKGFYKGFINDENGTDIIYSVENVGAMSDEEYNKTKNVLHAQIRKIGLPSNYELKRASSGGDVYVHSYTKEDGTHVRDYYRSYPNR